MTNSEAAKRGVGKRGPDKATRKQNPNWKPGRKSREELGLPVVRATTIEVEETIIALCRQKHGSLANALRYAAKKRVKTSV